MITQQKFYFYWIFVLARLYLSSWKYSIELTLIVGRVQSRTSSNVQYKENFNLGTNRYITIICQIFWCGWYCLDRICRRYTEAPTAQEVSKSIIFRHPPKLNFLPLANE